MATKIRDSIRTQYSNFVQIGSHNDNTLSSNWCVWLQRGVSMSKSPRTSRSTESNKYEILCVEGLFRICRFPEGFYYKVLYGALSIAQAFSFPPSPTYKTKLPPCLGSALSQRSRRHIDKNLVFVLSVVLFRPEMRDSLFDLDLGFWAKEYP